MRTLHVSKLTALSVGLVLALGLVIVTAAPAAAAGAEPQTLSPAPSMASPDLPGQDRPQAQGGSVDDELQLTQDQREQIAAIVDDENQQIAALGADNSLTPEQKEQKAVQIRREGVPKIKAMLTPEQLKRLAAMVQERARQQDHQQGAPQASGR